MKQRINVRGDQDPAVTPSAGGNSSSAIEPLGESTPEPSPTEDTSQRLEKAEQDARDNYDRLLRVSAEFDNYKKRTAREMQDVVKYATEKLARDLLTVIDNLERAIESAVNDRGEEDPLVKGVALTLAEIMKILEKQQIKPIEALGKLFDPALHQAMMTEVSADVAPNTVVREMIKGYTMHDRLLRAAMVSVSTAPAVED